MPNLKSIHHTPILTSRPGPHILQHPATSNRNKRIIINSKLQLRAITNNPMVNNHLTDSIKLDVTSEKP